MDRPNNEMHFPTHGGKMGKLIKAKDWDDTPIGNPDTWPMFLRAMVAVMLENPFGMCIVWGTGYAQLYNDGFASIFGMGNRPLDLGMGAQETFSESWDLMVPLIDSAMTGEAVGVLDFMLPLSQTGPVEERYFDISYSPIRTDNGQVGGVLMTVSDTTEKNRAIATLKKRNATFLDNIMQAPVAMCIFRGRDHIVEIANAKMLELWGAKADDVMNRPIFEGLPEARDQGLETLVDTVFTTGESFVANERKVLLPRNGKIEATYLNFVYEALKDSDGTVSGIVAIAIEVTDQVLARSIVEESEQKVRAMVESAPFPIAVYVGEEMRISLANESIINIWGKGNDVIGKSFKEVLPELGNQQVFEQIKNVYKTGRSFHTKNTPLDLIVNKKPYTYYFNYSFTPLYDIHGEIYGVMNTGVDLTDLNSAKKKIEESERRFRFLTESIPQLIWETDEKGNPLFASRKWMVYTGIKPVGTSALKMVVHPDDLEMHSSTWNESLATGEVYNCDLRIKDKSGNYKWHSVVGEPVLDAEDRIIKWVFAFTDIHTERAFTHELERLVAERTKELSLLNESLKKSEERYHLMVAEVQDYAILYLDPNGIIENWNMGAEKIKGYREGEIIGKHFSVFYTKPDRERDLPQRLLDLAREKGKALQEGWRRRKDGTVFWASVVITAVHNKKNEVIGFSKVTHDLTEKKKAEDVLRSNALELEQKNVELEKMNKELQSFAYISSHDLQEPLRKIQTFSSLIMEREASNLSDFGKDKFHRMRNAAQRMQILIHDLLNFSKINVQERTFEHTDLSRIIEEVEEDLKEELELAQARIIIERTCELRVIPFQFRQLLYNLFSNSLKFSNPNISPVIRIKSEVANGESFDNDSLSGEMDYCHIRISDNGIGFQPQYRAKIFEVFQRLHGRGEYSGTGVGLAIVKKIVDNHHGVISASGEPDKGATFDIYLPICEK
ncbi:MAG: PAS domain S-box protein [Sediminicola sp.]